MNFFLIVALISLILSGCLLALGERRRQPNTYYSAGTVLCITILFLCATRNHLSGITRIWDTPFRLAGITVGMSSLGLSLAGDHRARRMKAHG